VTGGLHSRYLVQRTDGSSEPGRKHEHCAYFVLDLEHDEHAPALLRLYAKLVKSEHPELSRDLLLIANSKPVRCGCREASCPHSLVAALSGPSNAAQMIMTRNRP